MAESAQGFGQTEPAPHRTRLPLTYHPQYNSSIIRNCFKNGTVRFSYNAFGLRKPKLEQSLVTVIPLSHSVFANTRIGEKEKASARARFGCFQPHPYRS
jgi:hypothetical protein